MGRLKLLILLLFLVANTVCAADGDDGRGFESDRGGKNAKHGDKDSDFAISSDLETRSRMVMLNGNMHFRAGNRRNITFDVSETGGIFFRDLNIMDIPSKFFIQKLIQAA
ncbi:unnamed protein product [Bursaphelenchus okinawaensis]|uniref:Uncharacterized protein n=1 Tax=Bursaphelenchus okinawaensis TaxID=465554 RepID=A0A811L2L7_9BILA|nr:unnamed protein product [Bursaphelenchus okinawaensis]CAG9117551.1 unnamed protein product [Bursaphelenchus okinawaensis]